MATPAEKSGSLLRADFSAGVAMAVGYLESNPRAFDYSLGEPHLGESNFLPMSLYINPKVTFSSTIFT
jgi:hypothetical protein